MATISTRKAENGLTTYQAKVRLKGHSTQSATFSRLTDAKRWASKTETAIRDGKYFPVSEAKKKTVADLVKRYLKDVLPHKKDQVNPKRQLEWWRNRIGHLALADVTPAVLAEAKEALQSESVDWSKSKRKGASKRGPATANRYRAVLSHAFTMAVREWGWADSNPFAKVSNPKEPRGRVRYLSDDERKELLKACLESGHSYLHPAVVLALSTGARAGELLRLKWADVDLKNGKIILYDTKNGDIRPLPLLGHARKLIRGLHRNRTIGTDWVFPGRRNRKTEKIGPIDLRTPWLEALRRANIQNFRWHDLRHSAASYLAMNGASLAEIAAILGHRQLSMVQRYAHLSPQHTAGVVASMNEQIFGNSDG